MKKSFLFASLVAIVAILAPSCKKAEAPKARFNYEMDGLTVKFTNASTPKDGNLTYAWDFGDKATSTEANPTHTYAEYGEYTVKLTAKGEGGEDTYSEDIAFEAKSITIDGDFADWDGIPKDILAVAEVSEDAVYENLYKIMLCSDADYVYLYAEYNGEDVGPMDIFVDMDDNTATGTNSYLFEEPSGTEVLFEGFPGDEEAGYYEGASIFTFAGATPDEWAWDDSGITGAIKCGAPKKLANGHTGIEMAFMRAMMPATPKSWNIGIFTSDADWAENGALPETTINGDGETVKSPVLKVKLQ